jgi:hypothetical protein
MEGERLFAGLAEVGAQKLKCARPQQSPWFRLDFRAGAMDFPNMSLASGHPLTRLLPARPFPAGRLGGWTLVTAEDVNSNEWIVGLGTDSAGQNRGYVLVPQSEY